MYTNVAFKITVVIKIKIIVGQFRIQVRSWSSFINNVQPSAYNLLCM